MGGAIFSGLQDRIGVENPSAKLLEATPAVYYAFDLLYCDGYDLRKAALARPEGAAAGDSGCE